MNLSFCSQPVSPLALLVLSRYCLLDLNLLLQPSASATPVSTRVTFIKLKSDLEERPNSSAWPNQFLMVWPVSRGLAM